MQSAGSMTLFKQVLYRSICVLYICRDSGNGSTHEGWNLPQWMREFYQQILNQSI